MLKTIEFSQTWNYNFASARPLSTQTNTRDEGFNEMGRVRRGQGQEKGAEAYENIQNLTSSFFRVSSLRDQKKSNKDLSRHLAASAFTSPSERNLTGNYLFLKRDNDPNNNAKIAAKTLAVMDQPPYLNTKDSINEVHLPFPGFVKLALYNNLILIQDPSSGLTQTNLCLV